jgi:hypothetical protein
MSETETLKTHDHRKIHHYIYQIAPEHTIIRELPKLLYVSQRMNTTYNMDWDGHPESMDEKWIAWKVANQLKQLTKDELGYKFKRMPPEIIWHEKTEKDRWLVDQMLLVADCVTEEMFIRALDKVRKSMRVEMLPISLWRKEPTLTALRLHIGHYKDTKQTLQLMKTDVEKQGYQIKGPHREIYLTPAMACYPAAKTKTVVTVEIE